MISRFSIFSGVGIVVGIFGMRLFMKEFRAKGVEFIGASLVLRSFLLASIFSAPVVILIWYICREYRIDYSMNAEMTIIDSFITFTMVLIAIADLCIGLLLAREYHRVYDQRNDKSSDAHSHHQP